MKTEKPWELEPNTARWVDAESGLRCLILRTFRGTLNGYVRIPKCTTLYRRLKRRDRAIAGRSLASLFGLAPRGPKYRRSHGYSLPKIERMNVHGGVTFSGRLHHHLAGDHYWIGFDTSHANDLIPGENDRFAICLTPGCYRDFAYVRAQTALLAGQLKEEIDRLEGRKPR